MPIATAAATFLPHHRTANPAGCAARPEPMLKPGATPRPRRRLPGSLSRRTISAFRSWRGSQRAHPPAPPAAPQVPGLWGIIRAAPKTNIPQLTDICRDVGDVFRSSTPLRTTAFFSVRVTLPLFGREAMAAAHTTACTRSDTRSLVKMCSTCVLTVLSATKQPRRNVPVVQAGREQTQHVLLPLESDSVGSCARPSRRGGSPRACRASGQPLGV
jgi:hypothetical protein